MVLFEKVHENAEALRQVGARALEEAKLAGVPIYYMEPAQHDGIIREFPDGHRELIATGQGVEPVAIPPRS